MGFFDRLKEGLKKTRANFTDSMDQIFNSYERVDEDFYEELEETMIMGDIGVQTTERSGRSALNMRRTAVRS